MEHPTDPDREARGATPIHDLVERFGGHRDTHDGHDRWWTTDPDHAAAAAAAAAGLVPTRLLHQMRRPLPLDLTDDPRFAPTPTRAFDPRSDTDAFLTVNNAAFAWHPDQHGWTRADLDARMAEPWFDADGFRVTDTPTMTGFCWTKVHPADPGHGEPDARGEIYVIAVDPTSAGHGLGTGLTIAGLEWLWRNRATPVAMLYVEHDNDAALATYRRIGFEVHATDVAFSTVAAGDTVTTDPSGDGGAER